VTCVEVEAWHWYIFICDSSEESGKWRAYCMVCSGSVGIVKISLAVWWSLHRLQQLPEEYGTIRSVNLSFRLEGTHYAPSQPDEPDSRVSV